jgi:hypothetical protein
MSDFMPSSPKIDEIVGSTMGPEGIETMRAAIKAALESNPQAAPVARPVQSAPQTRPTTMRRFYVGNNAFELYGTSDADLQAQEDAIRGLYSGRQ